LPITPALDASVQVGLFLCCLICQLSADCFFLLNIFFGEGVCKVFWLEDLADLDLGFACVGVGEALDPAMSKNSIRLGPGRRPAWLISYFVAHQRIIGEID
jgi:hypothetical protein